MILCLFLWDQLGWGSLSDWISVLQNVMRIWNQYGVVGTCTAKLTQARVIGDEGAVLEKIPTSNWIAGKPVWHFLN